MASARVSLGLTPAVLAGLAAIANITTVSYDISARIPSVMTPETTYVPLLWAFFGSIIHLFGAVALYLRVRVAVEGRNSKTSVVWSWLTLEFTPWTKKGKITVQILETYLDLFLSWIVSVGEHVGFL